MLADLRDAYRGLRAAPGIAVLALVILTLGIASATVTFTVVDTTALRRMPFPEPSRLVAIARQDRGSPNLGVNAPQDFMTWQSQVPAIETLAGLGPWPLTYSADGRSEQLTTYRITANLFDVLKVRPALGAGFTTANERAGEDLVVVLSHGAWMRVFGGDSSIVGRQVVFGKEVRQVIGVMPRGFTYPIGPAEATDAWVPHVPRASDLDHGSQGRSRYLHIVGRLRDGATIEQARDQVSRATAAVVAAYPNQTFWKDGRPIVLSLQEFVVGPAGGWLVLVLGAVVLVLLIAYVNVANLLVARATVRARELALRAALGATRARIARILVAESLMLSLVAAALAIVLSVWGVSLATASLPPGLSRAADITLDLRVLAAAIVAAIVTGLVFGVVPAWYGSRADVMTVMKQGGAAIGAGGRAAHWQRALLVIELAFVVTVLVAASLFITSFVNILRTDLGFTRGNLVAVPVSKSISAVPEADRRLATYAFATDVLARASAVPGVRGAALVNGGVPLSGMMSSYSIKVPGYGGTAGADRLVLRQITPNYFDVAGVPLVYGRTFDPIEQMGTNPVAIINDEAVRRFFGGRNPVGEVIDFRGTQTSIVGVVRSVRLLGPEADLRPELYVPFANTQTYGDVLSGDVLLRFATASPGAIAAVREVLKPVSTSTQPPKDIDAQFWTLTAERRFNAGMMVVFGLLALGMAAMGVYGLMSFVVAQQRRTIGVRLALGATTARIFRGVLAESARLLAVALTLGLIGGWTASRLFSSVIFGVTGTEPWLYTAVALILGTTAFAATLLPARRAARVDPIVALRTE